MSVPVALDMAFLYLDASSVASHRTRLSGPAPSDPPAAYESGTDKWDGPFGPTIETWTDITHPTGDPSVNYTAPTTPNVSWLLDSEIPDGWYTVIIDTLYLRGM
jgi:hypothetical protein